MTTAPNTTGLTPEMTSRHQDLLNDFAEMSHVFARLALEEAKAKIVPVATATIAFDRHARIARRCIWLIHKLAEPIKIIDRTGARKQIIRVVEDNIQRHVEDPEDADELREELMDRLDSLDLEDEIGSRTVDEIITDIVRDLGLAHVPGNHPWKRRTPADLAELQALAAQQVPNVERTTSLSRGPAANPLAFLKPPSPADAEAEPRAAPTRPPRPRQPDRCASA